MRDLVVDNVIDKYYERSQIGITKYGTTLNRPCFYNGTTWITL